jgi:hypothetical protein
MNHPPALLDGADVIQWAASRTGSFYVMAGSDPPIVVAAMTICRYHDGPFYLFKCNPAWEVVQDWDCVSREDAVEFAIRNAGEEALVWQSPGSGP